MANGLDQEFVEQRESEGLVRAATAYLEQQGVDIIVSNQSAGIWRRPFRGAGYLQAPSNFVLATSKPLTQLRGAFDQDLRQIHINRGAGEGPINL